ncbi:tripartite tricarboxylate transporter TctB family protein [Agromyces mediolanus]|uniref:tripartite tricarboxylate transporter TctB family protein n=1 Tax=Agromyces mediolanus TaxID=41986 RepID=UPI00383589FF
MTAETPDPAGITRPAGAGARRPVGELVFAAVCALLGVGVIIGAGAIRVPPGSASVLGPRVFPYFVGALLLVSAIAVIVAIATGHRGQPDEGEDVDPNAKTDWRAVLLLVAVFCSQLVLIEFVGWPIAIAVVFAGAALTLGAKRWWVAVLVGLGLGLATQLLFGTWLGLSLPAGPLLDWIPIFNG